MIDEEGEHCRRGALVGPAFAVFESGDLHGIFYGDGNPKGVVLTIRIDHEHA